MTDNETPLENFIWEAEAGWTWDDTTSGFQDKWCNKAFKIIRAQNEALKEYADAGFGDAPCQRDFCERTAINCLAAVDAIVKGEG